MERWEEEIEILEEEFRRTVRSFEHMAEAWGVLAMTPNAAVGYSAYAFEHSQMYRDMAEDCRRKFGAAGGTWAEACTLSDLISRQRQAREL
jgi:hypothetical protein